MCWITGIRFPQWIFLRHCFQKALLAYCVVAPWHEVAITCRLTFYMNAILRSKIFSDFATSILGHFGREETNPLFTDSAGIQQSNRFLVTGELQTPLTSTEMFVWAYCQALREEIWLGSWQICGALFLSAWLALGVCGYHSVFSCETCSSVTRHLTFTWAQVGRSYLEVAAVGHRSKNILYFEH
jgi:hypothetical protein